MIILQIRLKVIFYDLDRPIQDCPLNYINGVKEPFWFSLDQTNAILRYGKGYQTQQLSLLEATIKDIKKEGEHGIVLDKDFFSKNCFILRLLMMAI